MSELARFLFQKGHFSASVKRVKPAGFNPGNRPDLSVFDVRAADEQVRRALGAEVAALQNRAVKARAEIMLSALDDLPLSFERDDVPLFRHGNILGFPVGDDEENRSARLELATALASRATLCI